MIVLTVEFVLVAPAVRTRTVPVRPWRKTAKRSYEAGNSTNVLTELPTSIARATGRTALSRLQRQTKRALGAVASPSRDLSDRSHFPVNSAGIPRCDLFLSYSRMTRGGNEYPPQAEITRDRTFVDREELVSVLPWPEALKQALHAIRAWQFLELVRFRRIGRRIGKSDKCSSRSTYKPGRTSKTAIS